MYHQHFKTCPSTQLFIKENWTSLSENGPNVLISTDEQTSGVGRRGNNWITLEHSIAFSMTLEPSEEFSLTSLELGVLVAEFFPAKVQLKWPNDLLNQNHQKCGGIICNVIDNKTVLAGVGINLFVEDNSDYDFKIPPGGLFNEVPKSQNYKKDLPCTLAEYIINNRLPKNEILNKWNSLCGHIDKNVSIVDQNQETKGKFKGIGTQGNAIIETNSGLENIMSGSLFFD